MSRMTGRKETLTSGNRCDQSELDLSRSIKYLKSYTSKKISFDQQISREKANDIMNRNVLVTADYSYDYKQLKPKKNVYVCFAKGIGRGERKKTTIDHTYSYTHYDYNDYVWKGRSNVYSNTKLSVADFDKQLSRRGSNTNT